MTAVTTGKRVVEEGEVAHQQCAALEDEETLVDAGAPAAAAGEQDTDVDVGGMRSIHHGEVSLLVAPGREEDGHGARARSALHQCRVSDQVITREPRPVPTRERRPAPTMRQ